MTISPLFFITPPADILDTNDVHLWFLDLQHFTDAQYAESTTIMSADERDKAQKFIRGKTDYIASRWLLRRVLARYANTAPEQLVFERTAKGKPYIPQSDIQFSLSHSGTWAVLGVSRHKWLGVDIEFARPSRDLVGIATSYFHPSEAHQLGTKEPAQQHDYFYRLWTLKEAFFKAIGTGISAGLEKISFDFKSGQISAELAPEFGIDGHNWQFFQWQPQHNCYCALACSNAVTVKALWFNANELM